MVIGRETSPSKSGLWGLPGGTQEDQEDEVNQDSPTEEQVTEQENALEELDTGALMDKATFRMTSMAEYGRGCLIYKVVEEEALSEPVNVQAL